MDALLPRQVRRLHCACLSFTMRQQGTYHNTGTSQRVYLRRILGPELGRYIINLHVHRHSDTPAFTMWARLRGSWETKKGLRGKTYRSQELSVANPRVCSTLFKLCIAEGKFGMRVCLVTKRKSLRKFNLRPLATTCRSV